MTEKVRKVLAMAMELDPTERTEVVTHLLESLATGAYPELDPAWSAEVAERIAALTSGKVKSVPWAVAREQILNRVSSR